MALLLERNSILQGILTLDFPRMTKQNLPVMSSADQDLMRKGINTHGTCVRQRTVRQETIKYMAGTLPLNMYQTDTAEIRFWGAI